MTHDVFSETAQLYALFFEVRPKPGHLKHYFEHVEALRPVLAQHAGLLFLDRYKSLSDHEVLLSHQLWQSEEAIIAWRKDTSHRRSQTAGRKFHFEDYRIRVGKLVCRATADSLKAPGIIENADETRHLIAMYGTKQLQIPGQSEFESVNTACNFISLRETETQKTAVKTVMEIAGNPRVDEVCAFQIIRDYGMKNRDEAPC